MKPGRSKKEEKASNKLRHWQSASPASDRKEKGGRFLRRQSPASDAPAAADDLKRSTTQGSKGFLGRASRSSSGSKEESKVDDTSEVASDGTDSSAKQDAPDRPSRRWSRKERRGKRNSVPGGARTASELSSKSEHDGSSPLADPKKAAAQEDLDILRTARISKRGMELEVTYKYPEVKLTPHGENWASDWFSLIHNAIRAELRDMFLMGTVMQKRKTMLTLKHIDVFYDWWDDFKEFVTTALTIEEEVVFKKGIASKDYLRGAFRNGERMRVNGSARKVIENVNEYRERFLPHLPVGERLDGLLEMLGGFAEMLKHYEAVAEQLPNFIEVQFKQKERDANLKQMVRAFRSMDGYNRNLVLLVRWMPERIMKAWAFNHMSTKDLIAFRNWRKMIVREHCALASKYEDIVMDEEEHSLGAPVIGAAMAINEEMREHIDNNRASVRSLPQSAFTPEGRT